MKALLKKCAGFLSIFGLVFVVGCTDKEKEVVTDVMTNDGEPAGEMMDKDADAEEVMEDEESMEESDDVDGDEMGMVEGVQNLDLVYTSPAGEETMKIMLSVDAEGKITEASATPEATHDVSLKMQTGFSEAFSEAVVGKEMKGLNVDIVGGASLTTAGFNEAVQNMGA